ncbi:MAG: alcohol dehydrogenase-like regulatory protein ErcA [Chitinophagales bacterium]
MPNELHLRKFVAPEIVFGVGARHLAGRYAQNLGARKVLVVTDPGIIEAGWTKQVLDSLGDVGVPYAVFDGLTPNPKTHEVMAGTEFYRKNRCDVIIAVGGGSVIDCAKGIGIVDSNGAHIATFEGVDKVGVPIAPLVCIPTTAGSSADVSQFAVIKDPNRKSKFAIASKALVPDVALIDPITITTMPRYLSACTGLDTLTHAIEAFVSNASSPLTDIHALEAVRLISEYLLPSLENPDDIVIRSKVMLATMEAGLAFSNAILGAVHAMAHALGGLMELPHGECNAILLESVIDFNYSSVPDRYASIAEAMGIDISGMTVAELKTALLSKIRDIRIRAGVVRGLKDIGVEPAHISELSAKALEDVCIATNPISPTLTEVGDIFYAAL